MDEKAALEESSPLRRLPKITVRIEESEFSTEFALNVHTAIPPEYRRLRGAAALARTFLRAWEDLLDKLIEGDNEAIAREMKPATRRPREGAKPE